MSLPYQRCCFSSVLPSSTFPASLTKFFSTTLPLLLMTISCCWSSAYVKGLFNKPHLSSPKSQPTLSASKSHLPILFLSLASLAISSFLNFLFFSLTLATSFFASLCLILLCRTTEAFVCSLCCFSKSFRAYNFLAFLPLCTFCIIMAPFFSSSFFFSTFITATFLLASWPLLILWKFTAAFFWSCSSFFFFFIKKILHAIFDL
mmetsp:Transcript_23295/g.48452  ORF Transcript_23295/g.48452 Transcript_23295/m.48452 type:complete len:204 (-) Transcript_23295:169-780(-)